MVLITWLCRNIKMIRLGKNMINDAAAAIPWPATVLVPPVVEVRVLR
jgi:hypothetical protein